MKFESTKQLDKFLSVSVETALEIAEKKKFFAFINNIFGFAAVVEDLPQLAKDTQYVNDNPELYTQIERDIIGKFGDKYGKTLVSIVFKHVFRMVLANVGGGFAMAEEIKEFNETPKEG